MPIYVCLMPQGDPGIPGFPGPKGSRVFPLCLYVCMVCMVCSSVWSIILIYISLMYCVPLLILSILLIRDSLGSQDPGVLQEYL